MKIGKIFSHKKYFIQEFKKYLNVSNFICILQMTGKDMCALSKEEFCARAPVFVGDILWEHLVLLQQDVDRESAALKNAPSNLSETSTEPVSAHSAHFPASPQKTYHTLSSSVSPPRHAPYSAPTPPLSYASLDSGSVAPPLNIVKTEFKTEYPAPAPAPSVYQQHYQQQYYQPAPAPGPRHYQPYYGSLYDMSAPSPHPQQYPAFPPHAAPAPAPAQVAVSRPQWAAVSSVSPLPSHSYQVRIISHYPPRPAPALPPPHPASQ